MERGIDLIGKERVEQLEKHGRSIEMDVKNNANRQLVVGASALLQPIDDTMNEHLKLFPEDWDKDACMKMTNRSYKGRVIIAAALLCAELDRIEAIELNFTNPVLSPENIEQWKEEFNAKMKLWYDLDNYIPGMIGDNWQTDLYEGSTVDAAIQTEKNEWHD